MITAKMTEILQISLPELFVVAYKRSSSGTKSAQLTELFRLV